MMLPSSIPSHSVSLNKTPVIKTPTARNISSICFPNLPSSLVSVQDSLASAEMCNELSSVKGIWPVNFSEVDNDSDKVTLNFYNQLAAVKQVTSMGLVHHGGRKVMWTRLGVQEVGHRTRPTRIIADCMGVHSKSETKLNDEKNKTLKKNSNETIDSENEGCHMKKMPKLMKDLEKNSSDLDYSYLSTVSTITRYNLNSLLNKK